MVTIKTNEGLTFSTSAKLPELKIKEDTFHYHESSRALRFDNYQNEEMFIPFESVRYVTKTKKEDGSDRFKTTIEKDINGEN